MRSIQFTVTMIGTGVVIGFSLIVYAHANFSTKESLNRIEQYQRDKDVQIIKRLDKMDSKIDILISK